MIPLTTFRRDATVRGAARHARVAPRWAGPCHTVANVHCTPVMTPRATLLSACTTCGDGAVEATACTGTSDGTCRCSTGYHTMTVGQNEARCTGDHALCRPFFRLHLLCPPEAVYWIPAASLRNMPRGNRASQPVHCHFGSHMSMPDWVPRFQRAGQYLCRLNLHAHAIPLPRRTTPHHIVHLLLSLEVCHAPRLFLHSPCSP